MASFSVRPDAWREINLLLDYLEENAGLNTADRFLTKLIESFDALAKTPRMGTICSLREPALRRLRRWPVKDFENWLIFYQPTGDGVEVYRVIQGARDIESLLED